MVARYVLEGLTEQEVLEIDAHGGDREHRGDRRTPARTAPCGCERFNDASHLRGQRGTRSPRSPMPPRSADTVTPALLRDWPLPSGEGGKEGRGRTLVVGGSAETPGGVLLAARGGTALRRREAPGGHRRLGRDGRRGRPARGDGPPAARDRGRRRQRPRRWRGQGPGRRRRLRPDRPGARGPRRSPPSCRARRCSTGWTSPSCWTHSRWPR